MSYGIKNGLDALFSMICCATAFGATFVSAVVEALLHAPKANVSAMADTNGLRVNPFIVLYPRLFLLSCFYFFTLIVLSIMVEGVKSIEIMFSL